MKKNSQTFFKGFKKPILFLLLIFNLSSFSVIAQDTDMDGIADISDLDNDNDGILDSDEKCTNSLTNGWTASGNTASSSAGGVNYTFSSTVTNGPASISYTPNGTTNGTNFWSNSSVAGSTSLEVSLTWDSSPDGNAVDIDAPSDDKGTQEITISFDQPVSEVVVHVDRLGGYGQDPNTLVNYSNSAEFILTNSGINIHKLSGNNQLEVLVDRFFRSPNVNLGTTIPSTESNNTTGTAAGSILFFSTTTFTSLTFSVTGIGVEGVGLDGIEFIFEGCAAIDTDNDGIADYFDTDSDGDGCPDAIEGGGSFTIADIQNDTLTGGVDANGIPIVATSSGQTVGDSQDASTQGADCPVPDNDGDGIADAADLDDDNDGILDTDEDNGCSGGGSTQVFATAISSTLSWTNINELLDGTTNQESYPNGAFNIAGEDYLSFQFASAVTLNAIEVAAPNILDAGSVINVDGSNNNSTWTSITQVTTASSTGAISGATAAENFLMPSNTTAYTYYRLRGVSGKNVYSYVNEAYFTESTPAICDTDNDGIPNSLETDSDGDGCPDAIEGGGSFTIADIQNDTLTGGVDANGIPIVATSSGQTVGDSQDASTQDADCPVPDNDGDGIADADDLDNDNDGILDEVENSCGSNSVTKVVFFIDDSGSIDNTERANMRSSVQALVDNMESLANVEVAVLQYGGTEGTFGIQGYKVLSGYTANPTISLPNDNSLYSDHLPESIDQLIDDGLLDSGGLLESPSAFFIFTDANRIYYDNSPDFSVLFDDAPANSPESLDGLGEYARLADTYGFPLSVYHVGAAADDVNGIQQNGGIYIRNGNFTISNANINALTNSILDNAVCVDDTDGDGTPDYLDTDSDGDGCPDAIEGTGGFTYDDVQNNTLTGGVDANGVPVVATASGQNVGSSQDPNQEAAACFIDTDGDGISNRDDIDSDNDGIPDDVEILTASNGGDTDGDGIPDHLDLDSDNDGIPDLVEAGGMDSNGDGIVDDACNTAACDVDGDGLMDSADAVDDTANANPTIGTAGTTLPITDTDGDGNPDFQDLDSDNDGINDIVEAGIPDTDNDGLVDDLNPDGTLASDTDGDGYTDTLDPNDNTTPGTGDGTGTPVTPADTDEDGTPDFQDLDSDNDGINDIVESGNAAADADGDGIADNPTTDTDNDGIPDSVDADVNGFGDTGSTAPQDTDNDNVPDYQDLDSDDDGILDIVESGNEAADTDNDGVADGPDADGDGVPDSIDENPATFGDAGDAGTSDDLSDPLDPNSGGTGVVADSGTDADGDGIADSVDTDDANFGSPVDTDGDGIIDSEDLDDDNDGIPDTVENAQLNADIDGDGIPNSLDLDSDNDGISDLIESGNLAAIAADTNGDGTISNTESDAGTNGIPLVAENGTEGGSVPAPVNTDSDSVADPYDLDSDNDGIYDVVESGHGSLDTDNDGVITSTDTGYADIDKDGIPDGMDSDTASFGGTTPQGNLPDSDSDGIIDALEIDSDNDGVSDLIESGYGFPDIDEDGAVDGSDTDSDGIINIPALDDNTTFGGAPVDEDNLSDANADGTPDYQEPSTNTTTSANDFNNTSFETAVTADVSTNDEDPEADNQTFTLNTANGGMNSAQGSVTMNADGTYTFTPATGFVGKTSFSYSVCDDGLPVQCDTSTVFMEVLPATNPENTVVIANPDVNEINANSTGTGNVIANDLDPDNLNPSVTTTLTNATVAGVDNNGNPVANAGSLTLNADGTYSFTPAPGFTGTVTQPYTICNADAPAICDDTQLILKVSATTDNTTFANDDAVITDTGVEIYNNVSTNDTDSEMDNQSVTAFLIDSDGDGKGDTPGTIGSPTTLGGINELGVFVANAGVITLDSDGNYTFTPAPGFVGNVNMPYTTCDDAATPTCKNATLVMTILDVKRDYGDSPMIYPAAWHRAVSDADDNNVLDGTTDVWLGTNTSFETSQQTSPTGDGDQFDDAMTFGSAPGQFPLFAEAGQTYDVDITVNSAQADLVFYAMWIDWNEDGVYDDFHTGSQTTASPATATVSITAPAVVGNSVNVRLRADDNPFVATDFEGGKTNGEVEDFQALVVLPVKLTHFSGQESGCHVNLKWHAETEENFSHYEIQRSGDGRQFTTIKTIKGNGNTATGIWYSYTDKTASEFNYYRLKMIDLDDSFDYSKIINVNTDCSMDYKLELYPNPTSNGIGVLNVKFYAKANETQIRIIDVQGRTVRQLTVDSQREVINNMQLDISDLIPGSYHLNMIGGGKGSSKIFIIANE